MSVGDNQMVLGRIGHGQDLFRYLEMLLDTLLYMDLYTDVFLIFYTFYTNFYIYTLELYSLV